MKEIDCGKARWVGQGLRVAVCQPRSLSNARTARHIGLHWQGRAISYCLQKKRPTPCEEASSRVLVTSR